MIIALICAFNVNFASSILNTVVTPLPIGEEISKTQNDTWAYFKIKGFESPSLYLSVSIDLSEPESVCLVVKQNTVPQLYAGYPQYDWIDIDNWKLGSKKHDVIISPWKYSSYSLYIGVYLQTEAVIQYTIKAVQSEFKPCKNNCTENGTCDGGTCDCNSGYIGNDCQVPAISLSLGSSQQMRINPGSITYAYYGDLNSETGKNINVNIKSFGNPITVYIKPSQANMATTLPSESVFVATAKSTDIEYTINSKDLMTYFAIVNDDIIAIDLKWDLSYNSSSDNSKEIIFYTLITVSSVVVLSWVSFALYKSRKRFQVISNPAENYLERVLDLKIIDENFPEKKLRQSDIDRGNSSCPICLENFAIDDMIRELLCDHIYHQKCIDEWFATKSYCCLCKRDYKSIDSMDLTRPIEETLQMSNTLGLIVGANEESLGITISNPIQEEYIEDENEDVTFRASSNFN
ncbi:unnamed protein product [Blepharisma stoltei]|uniref:RING-type domain-containing protein n=1 Tax=Blepharisma stoltei TaxID=1481888 RepID=A0AAU9IM78_9CILI|nr:unnamed protein product [Blepharisma stoltei]